MEYNAVQQTVDQQGHKMIPLYAPKEVIDAEFELFICGSDTMFTPMELGLDGKFNKAKKPVRYGNGRSAILTRLLLRGAPITTEVKLFEMSNDKIGRLILSQYLDQPSLDLEGYERYMIKDYYVMTDGIMCVTYDRSGQSLPAAL